MFFDVIAKYTDESSERLMAYIGTESTHVYWKYNTSLLTTLN